MTDDLKVLIDTAEAAANNGRAGSKQRCNGPRSSGKENADMIKTVPGD